MTSAAGGSGEAVADRERNPVLEESSEQLALRVDRLLPVIRFHAGTQVYGVNPWRFGLALYPEGPVVFRTRRECFIPEAAFEAGGRAALLEARGIHVRFVSTWADLERVRAQQTNWRTVRFTFRAAGRSKISEHEITECGHLFDALAVFLGPRFQAEVPRERLSRRWIPGRLGPSLVLGALASVGLLWFGGKAASTPEWRLQNLGFSAVLLGAVCAARVESEWGQWLTRRVRSKRPAGVPPYRSRKLGLLLRSFGLSLLVAVQFAPWNAIIAYTGPNPLFSFFQERELITVLLLIATALTALDIGHRLALKSSEGVLQDDRRAPVVFLRSFEDDGSRNLNPDRQAARWLGLRGWFEAGRGIVARVLSAYPMRVLRLALGTGADTAEEQIARHLRKSVGPVIAIGRPGERVTHAGAARMYVRHDEWQQRVLDMLASCRAVVLQPSETRGVWWEVDQCLERLERRQILVSLVSFIGSAQAFEAFRLKWEDRTGSAPPRRRGDALFWHFGEDWTPIPIVLQESSPWLWPLTGSGIDWNRSLASFTTALGVATQPVRAHPPRRTRLAAPAALTWGIAGLVGGLAQSILLDPWLEAQVIAPGRSADPGFGFVMPTLSWQPHGRWDTVYSPRPGFQWEVRSNGGRYSAALACAPHPASAATSDPRVSDLRDFLRLHPGRPVRGGDGRTWMGYGLPLDPREAWLAPAQSLFVCVDSKAAWILELHRPEDTILVPPAVSAAILDSLLDMGSMEKLQTAQSNPAPLLSRIGATSLYPTLRPRVSLPPLWWAHYLAQRPPDPAQDLAIFAGDEWSLALDPKYWHEVAAQNDSRIWEGRAKRLRFRVWSRAPSRDLEEFIAQTLNRQGGKLVDSASSPGITGDPQSSREVQLTLEREKTGTSRMILHFFRTRTSMKCVSVIGSESAWQTEEPAALRALQGFLLLGEPFGP